MSGSMFPITSDVCSVWLIRYMGILLTEVQPPDLCQYQYRVYPMLKGSNWTIWQHCLGKKQIKGRKACFWAKNGHWRAYSATESVNSVTKSAYSVAKSVDFAAFPAKSAPSAVKKSVLIWEICGWTLLRNLRPKFSPVLRKYFRTFRIIFRIFLNIFEYFRTFSNVFASFIKRPLWWPCGRRQVSVAKARFQSSACWEHQAD